MRRQPVATGGRLTTRRDAQDPPPPLFSGRLRAEARGCAGAEPLRGPWVVFGRLVGLWRSPLSAGTSILIRSAWMTPRVPPPRSSGRSVRPSADSQSASRSGRPCPVVVRGNTPRTPPLCADRARFTPSSGATHGGVDELMIKVRSFINSRMTAANPSSGPRPPTTFSTKRTVNNFSRDPSAPRPCVKRCFAGDRHHSPGSHIEAPSCSRCTGRGFYSPHLTRDGCTARAGGQHLQLRCGRGVCLPN